MTLNQFKFRYLIGSLLFIFTLTSCKKTEQPEPEPEIKLEGILKTLHIEHPRLLMTDQRLAELKLLSQTDTRLKEYAGEVVAQADKDLFKSPIQHVLVGPRLLDKSRDALNRIYNLSFAYRWTGNEKYLSSAIGNMRNVCNFPDWNPSHFLDVAEMTHAVAIGYDWLYAKMDQATRDMIRDGLIRLGLNNGVTAYAQNAWWVKVNHNWNQVCNSGLLIGALAVAETHPSIADKILTKAIANLPYALKVYGPDGAWGEGPGYWGYATDYTAYGISALQTALGNDSGLTQTPGMNVTGYFPIYTAGPTGYMLNYADAGEKSKLGAPHPMMWLANVYNNNHFSDFLHEQLASRNANVYDVIWYRPASGQAVPRELDRYFGGSVALWFSRGSWSDPNALWVGFKAGYNKVNHAHLDLGNFELDALGVRWARDLGSDDYNLPDYFGSKRYTYYRLNSLSHNIPMISGKNQIESATSKFLKHQEAVAEPFAAVDLKEAYSEFASAVQRGIKVIDGRKAVVIQDEFTLVKPGSIVWGMTTDAAIIIKNPQEAELSLGGQKLAARILSPAQAVFTTGSAQQAAPQKTNTGVSRLLATLPETSGNVTLVILLAPQWPGIPSVTAPAIVPISQW